MGGQDKGLLSYQGEAMVGHVLRCIAPQVGPMLISANRHLDTYESLAARYGASVVTDELPESVDAYPGPLCGMLTGLLRCTTPYLAVAPCDTPHLPADWVGRLAQQLVATGRPAAIATTSGRRHPTLCLLGKDLTDDLASYLRSGQRKVDGCLARWQACEVLFEDDHAFRNINTPEQLQA